MLRRSVFVAFPRSDAVLCYVRGGGQDKLLGRADIAAGIGFLHRVADGDRGAEDVRVFSYSHRFIDSILCSSDVLEILRFAEQTNEVGASLREVRRELCRA